VSEDAETSGQFPDEGRLPPDGFKTTTNRRARHFIRSQKLENDPARDALRGAIVMGALHPSTPQTQPFYTPAHTATQSGRRG